MQNDMTTRYEVEDFIDPQPIFEALERRDDKAIWAAESASPSQEQFYERLREQVGHTTYETTSGRTRARVRHHSSMLMVPVIMAPDAADGLTGEATKGTIKTIVRWLTGWMGNSYTMTAFQIPLHYREVAIWGPSTMRARLDQLINKEAPSVALEPDFFFNLPPEAPSLSFLMAAVHSPLEWAKLPPEDYAADLQLTKRVSSALQYCLGDETGLTVLTPDFSSSAIKAGLMAWLDGIHLACGIHHWDAIPTAKDMVMLILETGDDRTTSKIPLRAHQIGFDGIQQVLARVAAIANAKTLMGRH